MICVNEQNFNSEVLESSRPVLLNFWAPWCGLCLMLNPMFKRLDSRWQGAIKLVSINADQNLQLANNYRLKNLPTLILIEGGEVVYRLEAFQCREDLYHQLNSLILNLTSKSA